MLVVDVEGSTKYFVHILSPHPLIGQLGQALLLLLSPTIRTKELWVAEWSNIANTWWPVWDSNKATYCLLLISLLCCFHGITHMMTNYTQVFSNSEIETNSSPALQHCRNCEKRPVGKGKVTDEESWILQWIRGHKWWLLSFAWARTTAVHCGFSG